MRVTAVALLAALLFSAASSVAFGANGNCCCGTGANAACPIKQAAAAPACHHHSETGSTCGMRRADSTTAPTPQLVFQDPTRLTNVMAMTIAAGNGVLLAPRTESFATRARRAPEAPPPKRA